MRFVSYFHDPTGQFLPLLKDLKDEMPVEVQGGIVAVSPVTKPEIKDLLEIMGFVTTVGGLYGEAKRNSVVAALEKTVDEFYFVCDFDKFLHWLKTDKKEFLTVLNSFPANDFTTIARSKKALSTYPKAWVETEMIATHIAEKYLGKRVDLMNGPYLLSQKAANIIKEQSIENGVGICSEWAYLAFKNELSLGNLEVNGLTWEDPDLYNDTIKELGSYEKWKDQVFDSPYEWRKRIEFLHLQIMVLIRLFEEPKNPKYPFVQNKFFEKQNGDKLS